MTPCPSCGVHFRVEADTDGIECPFCHAAFDTVASKSSLRRVMRAGRSGLLAASLFGAAALTTACSDEESGPDAIDVGDMSDADGTTDLADTDTGPDTDDATDIEAQPPYGIPPDTIEDTEDAPTDQPNNDAIAPAYGLPADQVP